MAIVLVHGSRGAGKTGVAAAVARHLAYGGSAVRLVRCSADPDDRVRADARWFAACDFAPGSPSEPVASPPGPGGNGWVVAECDQPLAEEPAEAVRVLVTRGEPPSADAASGNDAVVVTAVPAYRVASFPSELGGALVVAVPEDRTLAGFAIDELQRHLALRLLVEGDVPPDATCDELVIAPIGSDAGQPYFRRFAAPAVVARFDRTDMHLAALAADPVCLVLTGGRMPSGYTLDAAQAKGVPVLLAPTDTESTIHLLEDVFADTRFCGERKLDRMSELLAAAGLFERLPLPQAVG